jgi:transposase
LDHYLCFRDIVSIAGIDDALLANWIHALPGSPGTKNNKLSFARELFRHLMRHGLAQDNPAMLIPVFKGGPRRKPYLYSLQEIHRIIEEAGKLKAQFPNRLLGWSLETMLLLIYACGLRLGEAIKLRMVDVDFEEKTLALWNTKFHKERIVPFSAEVGEKLSMYLALRNRRRPQDGRHAPFFGVATLPTSAPPRRETDNIIENMKGARPEILCLHAVEPQAQEERTPMRLYIGMDVHKRYTVAIATDEAGKVLRKDRIEHGTDIARAPWADYFAALDQKPSVALEATGVSYAVLEAIEPYCESVTVSNPVRTRLIAEQSVKTDKVDAKVLAQLLRTNFLPVVHVLPQDIRDQRGLLRHRVSLVHMQTSLKNRIHSLLTRRGLTFEGTDLYGKAGREYLKRLELRPSYRDELDRYLRLLDTVMAEIQTLTQRIHREVEVCPAALRLTTIPGLGKYLAALVYWEIGDVHRFMSPSRLVGYCGLGPRVHSSGGRTFHGPISKEGNKFLRWALVEAAQKYGKRPGPMGDFYRRVQARKGSKPARVALARKLATILWHMMSKEEEFDESRISADRRRHNFG